MQSRRDFQEKHTHKDAGMDHTIVMGTLPSGDLPRRAKPHRLLLEVWQGDEPSPLVPTTAAGFTVEGTIVGDGRSWAGARWTTMAADLEVVLPARSPEHQVLVLQPAIDRWL
jgi:hypothetical protein